LAQTLLSDSLMFNHNRGLWGYTGTAPDGELLTVQSTGMGGPSAAIVMAELADLGARRFLRVGTCGALSPRLGLGDLVIVTGVVAGDGTSRALGASSEAAPDPALAEALLAFEETRAIAGVVVSTDLFYDVPEGEEQAWLEAGAVAVEMESAALFTLARRRAVQAGALLLVSDLLIPRRVRIDGEALRDGELRMGELALRALAVPEKT
jgi:uridine phosphorylase